MMICRTNLPFSYIQLHFLIIPPQMWKLVADSGEFHLTLSNAYRAHFYQLEIRIKKDILSEKLESGMPLKT